MSHPVFLLGNLTRESSVDFGIHSGGETVAAQFHAIHAEQESSDGIPRLNGSGSFTVLLDSSELPPEWKLGGRYYLKEVPVIAE